MWQEGCSSYWMQTWVGETNGLPPPPLTWLPRRAEIDQSTFWQWFVTIFGGSGASENQGAFSVVSGGCFTSRNASCVHSPGWPDFYIKDERCDIHAEQTGVVEVETFYAAGFRGVDGLRVDGRLYSGTGDGLQGLVLKVGTAISWEASVSLDALDILRMGNQSIAGFSICLAGAPYMLLIFCCALVEFQPAKPRVALV
jgi:hypothetical protein